MIHALQPMKKAMPAFRSRKIIPTTMEVFVFRLKRIKEEVTQHPRLTNATALNDNTEGGRRKVANVRNRAEGTKANRSANAGDFPGGLPAGGGDSAFIKYQGALRTSGNPE